MTKVSEKLLVKMLLVDYLLLTPHLFDVISDFDIIDFNSMFSDVHNIIHFNLSLPNKVIDNSKINLDTPGCIKKPRIKWKPNKANDCIQVLIDDHCKEVSYLDCQVANII